MGKRVNTAVWLEKYNRWQIKVQKDGERRTFTSSTPGRKGQRECNAKADAWLDDDISNEKRRAELLYSDYIKDLQERTSKSNWYPEESRGRAWILPAIGNKKLSAITDQHLQQIINNAFKAGLSRKSLTNLRATIMAFFKFCRKCKATKHVPENLIIPKGAPVGVRNIMRPQDLVKLFSSDTSIFNKKRVFDELIYAYRFQTLTGVRPGEMLGLRWEDITNDEIHLQRSINVFGEVTKGKNENAIRRFALIGIVKSILEKQRALTGNESYVFPQYKEERYLARWKRYCEANDIPPTTLYEMRHTFVSVIQGLPEAYIKSLVGHSKNMDTFGVYGHETTVRNQQMTAALEEVFAALISADKT